MKLLKITSFETICGTDFQEMIIDEFFDTIESNLGTSYAIYFNKSNNRFRVIYDDNIYYLELDKATIDNYVFGEFNPITLRLKQLVDKSEQFKELNDKTNNEIIDNKRIIANAEKGLIPNDKARKVYLAHLKKNKKFSLSKIKEYFSNLGEDIVDSNDIVEEVIWDNLWPFDKCWDKTEYFLKCILAAIIIFAFVFIGLAVIGGLSGGLSIKWLYSLLLIPLPFSTYLVPVTTFIGVQTKKRCSRLINFIKNRKLLNHKIKQLTEQLSDKQELSKEQISSSVIDSFNKTLPEPERIRTNPLEDQILRNLYDIVEKLKYINHTDRKMLLNEVRDISNEYVDRLEKIKRQNLEEGLQLGGDNLFTLQSDILRKIVIVEQKMLDIRNRDIDSTSINKEHLLLTEAINACYNDEEKIIGGDRSTRVRKPREYNN